MVLALTVDCYAWAGWVRLACFEVSVGVLVSFIHGVCVLEANNPELTALLNLLNIGAVLLNYEASDMIFVLAVANEK